MNRLEAQELISKYLRGECTDEETAVILEAYRIVAASNETELSSERIPELQEAAWSEIRQKMIGQEVVSKNRSLWRWYGAAAVLVMATTVMLSVFKEDQNSAFQEVSFTEIAPGANRATLTWSDGRIIALDEAYSGITVGEENITYSDGVALDLSLDDRNQQLSYAILSTPKGGTYQITLPDGTKVWLNAATTLKYPKRFDAGQRLVEISGEAYFSVAKDRNRPFRVVSNGQEIEVLGTEFNVSAYEGEMETQTTLVEGQVRINATNGGLKTAVILRPGQQALLQPEKLTVREVDTVMAVAWKNGFIAGNDMLLTELIPQIERWYEVTFKMEERLVVRERGFISIDRDEPLSAVLKSLSNTYGMNFTIKGREVIISK